MNFVKILIVAFSFIMISCGTKPNPQYSLKITKSSDFLKNGEKINIHINNPKKHKLEKIQFKINNSLINSTYTLNNKLGTNQIQVSFLADNKNFTLTKEIIIFSSIKPKLYSYEIINEFDHDIASYTQGLEFDNEFNLY